MTDNQSYRISRPGRDDRSPAAPFPHDGMTVVEKRYPGRWITTGVLALLLILLVRSVVMNDNFAWPVSGALHVFTHYFEWVMGHPMADGGHYAAGHRAWGGHRRHAAGE
ncbi:hypothetical protein [Sodalis glossinidius]|uniref:hypothetical protein n=1 Tax=Sodalis glossinidius TaxID=63612 RepID=UPI0014121488|nr:hypothetical protein [Sodalis glossinidius]